MTISSALKLLSCPMSRVELRICLFIYGAVFPVAAHGQSLGQGEPIEIPWIRLVLGLLMCLFLAVLVILTYKNRFGRGKISFKGLTSEKGENEKIDIVDFKRVTTDGSACVLKYKNKEFLIVINGNSSTLIGEFEVSEE